MTGTLLNRCHFGDCLATLRRLPDAFVHTCITSPPYFGLRDYGHPGQIGLEETPEAFIAKLVEVFREVRRVLRDDGTCWVNMGDSYAGSGRGWNSEAITGVGKDESKKARGSTLPAGLHAGHVASGAVGRAWVKPPPGLKQKDLIGVPWMLAFALRADGWYLRQDIVWAKPNPMPESTKDRCTKAHEYVFLLSKSRTYYFDHAAIAETSDGENPLPDAAYIAAFNPKTALALLAVARAASSMIREYDDLMLLLPGEHPAALRAALEELEKRP